MRILLVGLNAKYVHTNLALRYLRESVAAFYPDVLLREYSINEHIEQIAGEIYEAKADVIGFSCYIWNIRETVALIRHLRPVCPEVRFVLGGPEVSFEVEEFLQANSEVDVVVIGEGEQAFLKLLRSWQMGRDISHVPGLAFRTRQGHVHINPPSAVPLDLSVLPNPYARQEDFTGRLVYVETTRGCPFNCQYCLSSTFQGVRFLEPELFRQIFRHLLANGARTVKFVDRTFNAKKQHAWRILDIVREECEYLLPKERIRVHCEIAGELLDDEWMDYFRNYPPGLIQLEIGVQSTYPPTLKIISRPQNFGAWQKYIPEMQALGIPLHLDLIAGLPLESWTIFQTSFNDVYLVKPEMLQLGFLKVLKGSGLRRQSSNYGLVYTPDPPYTILATSDMSHSEMLQLQRMEDVLGKYYNSGKFNNTLKEALKLFPTPFDFYNGFAGYWQQRGWFQRRWQGKALFDNLWEYLEVYLRGKYEDPLQHLAKDDYLARLRDAMRFDYYLWERPNYIPEYLSIEASMAPDEITKSWKARQEEIRRDCCWASVIPDIKQMDRRQWIRNTAAAYFTTDVLDDHNLAEPCWYLFFYQQGVVEAYKYQGSSAEEVNTSSEG